MSVFRHLHIGAGKLGLGLIIPATSKSDYKVTVLQKKSINSTNRINLLAKYKKYNLIYTTFNEFINKTVEVKRSTVDIHDVFLYDDNLSNIPTKVLDDIEKVELLLITTSVGASRLGDIVPVLCQLLKYLNDFDGFKGQILVICCENGHRKSSSFRVKVLEYIQKQKYPYVDIFVDYINNYVEFTDTIVDRIVSKRPLETDQLLKVETEKFGRWIICKPQNDLIRHNLMKSLNNSSLCPQIIYIENDHYSSYEAQKKWSVNTIHLALASLIFDYMGIQSDKLEQTYLRDGLKDKKIEKMIMELQGEISTALLHLSKDQLNSEEIGQYNQAIIERIIHSEDTAARILNEVIEMSDTYSTLKYESEKCWNEILHSSIISFQTGEANRKFSFFIDNKIRKLYITPMLNKITERVSQPLEVLIHENSNGNSGNPLPLALMLSSIIRTICKISDVITSRTNKVLVEDI